METKDSLPCASEEVWNSFIRRGASTIKYLDLSSSTYYLRARNCDKLNANYAFDIGKKLTRLYTSHQAIDMIWGYDNVITETAVQYGLNKSFIQAVLYREIYCMNYLDLAADQAVMETYIYEQAMAYYNNLPWLVQFLSSPPSSPMGYRLGSSTGLGWIFASTAIYANNWALDNGMIAGKRYDVSNLSDRKEMWDKLKMDDSYNINMVGLVLSHKASLLGIGNLNEPEQGVQVIGKYNGNIAYGYLLYKYVAIFDQYNNWATW